MAPELMHRDALAAWLRLTLTPGVGNEGARKLLAAFGLPQSIFKAPETALKQVVKPSVARALMTEPPKLAEQITKTEKWLADAPADGVIRRKIVTLGDAGYPAALLNMEDPPPMLYLMGAGDFSAMPSARCIALVGSRNPTPQGAENARQFAQSLVEAGLTVVSGLALGVDGAAHEGALQVAASHGPTVDSQAATTESTLTIAVVGTGLDRVYPRQHHELAHRIAQHGLLVSEYPLGTPPLSPNFPRRNRLIAGLSRATLVVEAALKSGSLITARLASEQGRDVMAIPGSIHSVQYRGCHALIKQGAKLVESAQDVLEEFGPPFSAQKSTQKSAQSASKIEANNDIDSARTQRKAIEEATNYDSQGSLIEALGFDPVGLDALQARTGMAAAALQAELLTMELMGDVSRLPGGLFQRTAAA
jgi:DNA processing protein